MVHVYEQAVYIVIRTLVRYMCVLADRPDFIGTVPIFDFQNLQKSGHPDFLEFQPVYIPVFNVIVKT